MKLGLQYWAKADMWDKILWRKPTPHLFLGNTSASTQLMQYKPRQYTHYVKSQSWMNMLFGQCRDCISHWVKLFCSTIQSHAFPKSKHYFWCFYKFRFSSGAILFSRSEKYFQASSSFTSSLPPLILSSLLQSLSYIES